MRFVNSVTRNLPISPDLFLVACRTLPLKSQRFEGSVFRSGLVIQALATILGEHSGDLILRSLRFSPRIDCVVIQLIKSN